MAEGEGGERQWTDEDVTAVEDRASIDERGSVVASRDGRGSLEGGDGAEVMIWCASILSLKLLETPSQKQMAGPLMSKRSLET